MPKNQYQTFTAETPLAVFREDFLRRAAMCAALSIRYPELGLIATDCEACVVEIDARMILIQQAQDAQVRAKAAEDVEKMELVDAYTEARRTMSAKNYEVITILPDMPSVLARKRTEVLSERVDVAIARLNALPDGDLIRTAFVPIIEKEFDDFKKADKAEDQTSAALEAMRLSVTLYKTGLSQRREAQLGQLLAALRDKEKVAQLTIPWRKTSRGKAESEDEAPAGGESSPT